MAKIYTLECILNKLDLKTEQSENIEIIGKGKCGDIFNFTIRYYEKRSAFNVFSSHSGHGTSILFSCPPNLLIAAFTKDFKVTLEHAKTSTTIGTVTIGFDNSFQTAVQQFSDTSNTYKFEKSLSIINSSSVECGTLSIKGCLVYHGSNIEIPMNNFPSQMLIPMPKRGGTEDQWKPVFTAKSKPARSVMDPQMELYAEMSGVPAVKMTSLLTPEYIKKNLCGHIACPGARKFKEYGLGPLAAGGGLGTISTVQNVKPYGFYGMSQAYGTLDNYGAYGLFVKKPTQKTRKYCCGSPDCPYAAMYGLRNTDPGIVEVGEDYVPPPTPVKVCQCKKCQKCCKHGSNNSSKSSSQNSTCGGPLCPHKKQAPGTQSIGKPCPYRQAAGSDCEKYKCPSFQNSKGQSVRPSDLTTTRQQGLTTDDCRKNACPQVCKDSPGFSPSALPPLPVPTRYKVPSSDDCRKYNCPSLNDEQKKPRKSSLKQTSISNPVQPLTRVQVPQVQIQDCRDDCPVLKSNIAKPKKKDDCRDDCPVLKNNLAKPKKDDCRDDCPILKGNLAKISKMAAELEQTGIAKEDCPHIRLPETMPTLPVPTRFEGPFLSSDDDTSIRKRDNICEGLECPYHVGSGHPGTCPMGSCPLLTCGNKRKLSPRKEKEEEEIIEIESDSADKMKKKPPDKKKKFCPSKVCWTYEEPKPEEGPCGGFVCPSDKKKKDDSSVSPVASGDAYSGPTERLGADVKSKRLSLLVNEEGKKMLIKESLNKLNNRQRDILGSLQLTDNTDGYFMISRLLASRPQTSSMNNYLKLEEKEIKSGPCTRTSCKSLKYKTCSECGGMSRSGATCDDTNVSFSTVSYESIETILATRKTEGQLKAERDKKAKLALGPSKQAVKIKKKKVFTRFVYKAGENYPGLRIGHKTCNVPAKVTRNVPAQMGWLWNIRRDWEKKKNKKWKPGYLNKTIEDRIIQYRRARGIPDPPELKMLVKKKFTSAPVESEEEEEPVLPKPTLTIEKKEGNYLVTMNPLKDPKTLVDREDPYMRCKPIQFLITKQKKPPKPPVVTVYDEIEGEFEGEGEGSFDYNRCLCDETESCSTSSSDSELNIEFTTPAGLIIPERMKRPPNVVMVNTQFKAADFSCEDCPVIIPEKFKKIRKRKK